MISGTLVANPVAGAQVILWRELAHQSSFEQVAQTTTDSAGRYSFTLKQGAVMADQAWYVSSGTVHSATVQQHVTALVALATSARSTSVGRTVVLRGHVTPSHAGEVVLVEMRSGGAWRVIARPRLGRGSSYVVSHRFARAAAVQFRVVLRSDGRNVRSTSRTVKVTIKR